MPGDTVVPTDPAIPITPVMVTGRPGTVVFRLAYDYSDLKGDDLYTTDEVDGALSPLQELLVATGRPSCARAVRNASAEWLWSTELEARRSPFTHDLPPERWRSLTQYWRVDLSDRLDEIPAFLERVRGVPGVELAYVEGRIVDAGLVAYTSDALAAGDPADTARLLTWQAYQGPHPVGVDARYAWDAAGGTAGAGVGLVDLEQQWFKDHEDLDVVDPTTLAVTPFETAVPLLYGVNAVDSGLPGFSGSHGASVWGVVFGRDNDDGGVGLAPMLERPARISHMVALGGGAFEANHFTEAIVEALRSHMQPGDVLLIESQMSTGLDLNGGPATVDIVSPIEVQALERDAIQLAVSRGVVVIEPAGNGGADLDDDTQFWGGIFKVGHAEFEDSGAIMVGGSAPPNHNQRFGTLGDGTNYGSRVNCFAWGANVHTCGRAPPAVDREGYIGVFNGTSAASAIIAGVAVLVQSAYKAANGGAVLSPLHLRAILCDPTLGLDRTNLGIGVMPDLRRILPSLSQVPDVYLRDNLADTGVVPSAGSLSSSPDIIVRQAQVADPDATFGEGSANRDRVDLGEPVVSGHDHYVYVRAMNRGGAAASNTTARVFWSPPATLVTPDLWTEIGTTPPMSVPTGGALTVSDPLVWPAADLPAPGHYCFVALLGDDQDLPPPIPLIGNDLVNLDDFLSFVRDNNNVAWRNFNVIPDPRAFLGAVGVLPFFVVGAPGDQNLRFDLDLIQRFPPGSRVWLHLHPTMRGHWWAKHGWFPTAYKFGQWMPVGADRHIELGSFQLTAGARYACRMAVMLPKSKVSLGARIAVRQLHKGVEVGRITWQFGAAKL